ncbi:hypothetical protein JKG47_04405 [Acidithiobacillus sp. MC6.1]|nr:hypothetical protein [Acidithiobacillus sp. MC6.1]
MRVAPSRGCTRQGCTRQGLHPARAAPCKGCTRHERKRAENLAAPRVQGHVPLAGGIPDFKTK